MNRRVVRDGASIPAERENRRAITREMSAGAVLNILQSVRPGEARFTVEGEGGEVWCCPQAALDEGTFTPARAGSG